MPNMYFKDFAWPANPEKLTADYRREPMYGEDDQGRPVYLGMGEKRCIIRGSGEFTGPLAQESFDALQTLFAESTSGMLGLPNGNKLQAYFSGLVMQQDSRPMYVQYSFTFLGTDDSGGVPA